MIIWESLIKKGISKFILLSDFSKIFLKFEYMPKE